MGESNWFRAVTSSTSWRPLCATAGWTIALAFLVFRYGGVLARDWNIAACGIAVIALGLAVFPGRTNPPILGPGRSLAWLIVLLCAYTTFQMIPLPSGLVAALSPARFELTSATRFLGGSEAFVALSVAPSSTLSQLLHFLGYAVIFVSVHHLARQWTGSVWFTVFPLVLVGVCESAAGLVQAAAGVASHGTYINKNHFAGMLEMIVAFPAAYGLSRPRGSHRRVRVVAAFALAAAIALAIAFSTSRSGIIAGALAIFVTASVMGARRPAFVLTAAAAGVAVVAVTLAALPIEGVDAVRPAIWRDTLSLIRAFPITGSGLGTFETALFRYKTAAPLYTVDYAHNDYLQLLAELGVTGFLMLAAAAIGVVWKAAAIARASLNAQTKAVAGAGLGAFAAIALHSMTDFNLYIPANAMTLAWIAGAVLGVDRRAGAARREEC